MIYINAISLINALGNNKDEVSQKLKENKSGLQGFKNEVLINSDLIYLGKIEAALPEIPVQFSAHNSRNNQLLLHCINDIQTDINTLKKKYDSNRIAIILGTSTSGILEGEEALKHKHKGGDSTSFSYQQQCFSDPSDFLASYLQITGPSYTISTACSSSARSVITGARLIESGAIDAAIVGGADTLCRLSTHGFRSLGALSRNQCHPCAENRDGINIGEAAGLMILSKEKADLSLLGWGASSDAWHVSAPHPEGIGAQLAMQNALDKANLQPSDIGYINMHGTGTKLNDSAESIAIYNIFGENTPCSSTKHLTGHTLGAAGITEIAIAALMIQNSLNIPYQKFTPEYPRDTSLAKINLPGANTRPKTPIILSNSLAFGGNNATLIIGAAHD